MEGVLNYFLKIKKTVHPNLIRLEQTYFVQTTCFIVNIQYYTLQLNNLQVYEFAQLII